MRSDVTTLLGLQLNQLHLVDRYRTLAVYPFVLNIMLVFVSHHDCNALNRAIRHETKASWFVCSFVFEDHTVFQNAELAEIISKLVNHQVVRKASYKDFAILWIIHVDCLLDLIDFILKLFVGVFERIRDELASTWIWFFVHLHLRLFFLTFLTSAFGSSPRISRNFLVLWILEVQELV